MNLKKIRIGNTLSASEISLGCMRISAMSQKEIVKLIDTALAQGIDFFDHADIYGNGKSEEVFADALPLCSTTRDRILIQTKCGIHKASTTYFDFSYEHIIYSVENSLKRLKTDYIDVLLLHRPDTLMEPEEVAEAFTRLNDAGKVRYFGVSNQNPMQMELLQKYMKQKIIVNQLQLSIAHTGMIDAGLQVNMQSPGAINRDGSVLEYCRLKDITIQAWSPFQYGFFEGVFLGSDKYKELNEIINRLAAQYQVTNAAIAIAWILRHPAKIQPILGTTNPDRVEQSCRASDITLTRQEWYDIYRAAGNILP